ncbi:MAG: hypothetical protein J5616_07670 [Bacteroidaceae bacterium]|nr:hypothetical protein [Bacteroidaceae bacterium]
MEINDEILDEMIEFIECMPKAAVENVSIRAGEYKGYTLRVSLAKPEETQDG